MNRIRLVRLEQIRRTAWRNRYYFFWVLAVVAILPPFVLPLFHDHDRDETGGGVKPGTIACRVVSVYDGDTLTAVCGGGQKEKVRFYCIDTPEMQQKPWGKFARDNLRRALATKGTLNIRLRKVDTDRYGRIVGEVFANDVNLNLKQVSDGQAAVYRRYCSDNKYFIAERQAKAGRIGIWSTAGLHQTPWKFR